MNWLAKYSPITIIGDSSLRVKKEPLEGSPSSIRECCQNVITRYKAEEECPSTLPWDRGLLNPPDEMVGEISTQILNPIGEFVREDPAQLRDIITSISNTNRPKKILIRAGAGFGKTTLCNRIVRVWIDNGGQFPEVTTRTSYLVYLRFRTLRSESDLKQELLRFIRENYPHTCEKSFGKPPEFSARDFILLLDGYNEAKPKHQQQVKHLLSASTDSIFENSSVIITSRLDADREFLVLFDRHFVLRGLSDKAADVLVRKYYENSDSAVTFILSKFRDIIDLYKMPPLLLVTLCYLQRHRFPRIPETVEQALYHTAFEICKRYSESGGLKSENSENKLHDLGKVFIKCLHEKRFMFSGSELQSLFPDYRSTGLFKAANVRGRDEGERVEVIHVCFMEVLATHFLNEYWYSLPNDKAFTTFIPSFGQHIEDYEIFVYKDDRGEVSLKVIGEDKDVGFFVWDFSDGSCVFSTSLNKSYIPRKMGECSLNLNTTLTFPTQKSIAAFRSVFESLFPELPSTFSILNFARRVETDKFQLNFLVNKQRPLFPAACHLFTHDPGSECSLSCLNKLIDMSSEVNLTFLGKGCNHKDIVDVLRSLINMDMSAEKESNNALELLNMLKKYDTASSSYICTLAAVARSGYYYLVDTKRRSGFEDLRPWSKRAFFQPKYSWGSVDLLVLTYQPRTARNLNEIVR